MAKKAPHELRLLEKELSLLGNAIKLLVEEVSDPNSVLSSAGQTRVDMVNEIMAQAKATLLDLETYAKKHNVIQDNTRSKVKRAFDKLTYAGDVSKITILRSKIKYHYGVMNLLLTSLGKYVAFWFFSKIPFLTLVQV